MKVEYVRVRALGPSRSAPLRDALQTLGGGGSVEVSIGAGPGIEGLGSVAFGRIDGAPRALAALIEEVCAPVLIGRSCDNVLALNDDLRAEMEYFGLTGLARFAMAAIDCALWDVFGKSVGEPCYRLWGAHRDRLPAYAMVGWLNYDLDALKRECGRAVAHGFRGIKMKVGLPDLGDDLRRIAVVRAEIGDEIPLMVDANQVLDVSEALRRARAYEEHGIAWFEEPLPAHDLDAYAELTRDSAIPIATGENLYDREEFLALLSKRACRIVQPDIRRLGGPSEARVVAALAASFNVPYASHGGGAAALSVLMCAPTAIWLESGIPTGGSSFPVLEDGYALAPAGPGLQWA